MKSECSLIRELLPLYLENDVSDDTRRTIEKHLDECQSCKNALDQYVQASEPIPDESLPDPFDATQGYKKFIKRAQKYMAGAVIAVLLIICVIAAVAFFTGQQIGRSITYVENEEDVFDYYADKVPGLERAQKDGNYQNIGRSIDLPDDMGTVFFDKLWYSRNTVYVFYHIKPGKNLGRIEDVQLWGALYWDKEHEGRTIQAAPFSGGMHIGEWVSYDGLYYKILAYNNERERFIPADEAVIDQLKIDLNLTYIPRTQPFNTKQEQVKVGEVEFPALFDPVKEQSRTVQINKRVSLPDGIALDFLELVMEPQKSVLKLQASGLNGRELGRIYGLIKTDAGEELRLSDWAVYTVEDRYEVELRALENLPLETSIVINLIQLVTEDKLTFDLDARAFHDKMTETGYKQEVNKTIGTYAGTEYILEQLFSDDRGLDFTLLMKSPAFNSDVQVFMPQSQSWATYQVYLKAIQEEGKDPSKVRRTPNLVRFTNEKGEVGGMEDYGQTGGGPGQRISMFIDKKFVEKSETITVDVMNLVESISGEWKTK
ncbi:MAG TPA: hypothetical protein GX505_12705 [Clostridiales bacterium]|nr:hypothetical protein [Clostridiales bacterium]